MKAKSVKKFIRTALVLCVISATMIVASPAYAANEDMAPNQASCDNGSVTYTWDGIGIDRPVVASMTVDGETVPDVTDPEDGSIGVAVCSNFSNARKVGVNVYKRDGLEAHSDLAGALTPDGDPITADSEITLTLTNLGELAEFYSFSLVHGNVTSWTTANLGETNASLTLTFKPVRTPLAGGLSDFSFCTATPPNCNAESSGYDALSASLDMDFDQDGTFANFTGAYFALTGAMGGFVEATNDESGNPILKATLGAPHFLVDGETLNTGSMQAFIPDSVLVNLGLTPGSIQTSDIDVERTESSTTSDATFSITAVSGGLIVSIPTITFSSPVYTIKKAAAVSPSATGNGNSSLPETGASRSVALFETSLVLLMIGAAMAWSVRNRKRLLIKVRSK